MIQFTPVRGKVHSASNLELPCLSACVPEFKKGATELVKLIASRFAEMQLFVGEKMDYDGAFCFAYQKEQEDEGPTFLFFKDGLKENKY